MLFDLVLCLLSGHDSLTHCSPLLLFCHLGGLSFSKNIFLVTSEEHMGEYVFLQSRGGFEPAFHIEKGEGSMVFLHLAHFQFLLVQMREILPIHLSQKL